MSARRDTSNNYRPTQEVTNGAAHVSIQNGYAGPEGNDGSGLTLAVSGTAATSAAITGDIIDVIYIPDANGFGDFTGDGCFVRIAAAPTAVANDYYIAPNTTYRFPITSGNKISVIQSVSAGDLYVHVVSL